jgi:hypothetical protein
MKTSPPNDVTSITREGGWTNETFGSKRPFLRFHAERVLVQGGEFWFRSDFWCKARRLKEQGSPGL